MTKRMLIDATHPEETRVVVLDGNRLEEFDVETSTKQTLKGNIYLARVVRVEPSLQAAFVEFGGNRHGFLAFGEIHPDYYQIPVADRERLIALAEQEAAEDEQEDEEDRAEAAPTRPDGPPEMAFEPLHEAAPAGEESQRTDLAGEPFGEGRGMPAEGAGAPSVPLAAPAVASPLDIPPFDAPEPPATLRQAPEGLPPVADRPEDGTEATPSTRPPSAQPARIDQETVSADPASLAPAPHPTSPAELGETEEEGPARTGTDVAELVAEPVAPETIGGAETAEEDRPRRINPRFLRNYKIQEVIKRRQILLVQVVKEERGTKGAALTTYLSLAGRYCVLMPNTPRGGGISRKISSAADRKRLREIMTELALPKGMGIIVRTAGANRPKAEIKRDCEYLLRLWDSIRETTLASVAPALIYEEANLIKRSIRDVYSRDVDEVLVDGEDAYRAAKDFMRMLIPSHAKKVQLYRDGGVPLFARAGVEAQLDAMHSPRVDLRSGGSIVINQTEALVAIDVNSGRATRERNIEETAFKTNLEAADEIARQLRLRDLAGLIVIDFIDMETSRNIAAVERRLKEALKNDRARIQVGRISHFGLMEMSRQRLRPSLTETAFVTCPHCAGTGLVRSTESAAVHVLRAIEDEAAKRRAGEIVVRCAGAVALYLLNMKRHRLGDLESGFAMRILFAADDTLLPPALKIERTRPPNLIAPAASPAPPPAYPAIDVMAEEGDDAEGDDEAEDAEEAEAPSRAGRPTRAEPARAEPTRAEPTRAEPGESEGDRRRRRRRRRRGGRRDDGNGQQQAHPPGLGDQPEVAGAEPQGQEEAPRAAAGNEPPLEVEVKAEAEAQTVSTPLGEGVASAAGEDDEAQARRRRGRRGGRRRRREDEQPEAAATSVVPPSPRPPFQGATPANPFGDDASYDLFEAIERDLAASIGPAAEPKADASPPPTEPPHAPPPSATEPAMPDAPRAADAPVAPPPPPAPPQPEPGLIASMEIKPIVVDEAPAEAPRKRGWWRR